MLVRKTLQIFLLAVSGMLLCHCGGSLGAGNMGGPSPSERAAQIASEPKGDFYYGRRYYVHKTRFWGYIRKPGKSADQSQLVVMNESQKHCPDRLPENGPAGQCYGFDQNHEYRIWGQYTGRKVYDVNSNQFLPEFQLRDYQLIHRQPGWLFSPRDHYDSKRITLLPR